MQWETSWEGSSGRTTCLHSRVKEIALEEDSSETGAVCRLLQSPGRVQLSRLGSRRSSGGGEDNGKRDAAHLKEILRDRHLPDESDWCVRKRQTRKATPGYCKKKKKKFKNICFQYHKKKLTIFEEKKIFPFTKQLPGLRKSC